MPAKLDEFFDYTGNHSFHQTHPALLNTKTPSTISGQGGFSITHHVRSLSSFYVAVCYAFRRNNPTTLHSPLHKDHIETPKPNPVRSQALTQQNRLISSAIKIDIPTTRSCLNHRASSSQWASSRGNPARANLSGDSPASFA